MVLGGAPQEDPQVRPDQVEAPLVVPKVILVTDMAQRGVLKTEGDPCLAKGLVKAVVYQMVQGVGLVTGIRAMAVRMNAIKVACTGRAGIKVRAGRVVVVHKGDLEAGALPRPLLVEVVLVCPALAREGNPTQKNPDLGLGAEAPTLACGLSLWVW